MQSATAIRMDVEMSIARLLPCQDLRVASGGPGRELVLGGPARRCKLSTFSSAK
jgi:hypothetical protein